MKVNATCPSCNSLILNLETHFSKGLTVAPGDIVACSVCVNLAIVVGDKLSKITPTHLSEFSHNELLELDTMRKNTLLNTLLRLADTAQA